MVAIKIIPVTAFEQVQAARIDIDNKLALLADMCRYNALATIKRAGSGHIGTSFSAVDIMTCLFYAELNTRHLGFHHKDRDIFFSSKGHDAPALYAVLFSLGVLPESMFVNLRRLGGTHGHPDVCIPGVEVNSGSLGMGISKAKGLAFGKRLQGNKGRVFVMTGDGELQEGQIWEALQTAAHQRINDLFVIVDANKIQTDRFVTDVVALGDLETKFESFGWHVERCSGHDFRALRAAFKKMVAVVDRPKILIADTVKGNGVSFMARCHDVDAGRGCYAWHSGAPDDAAYEAACAEIMDRIRDNLSRDALPPLSPARIDSAQNKKKSTGKAEENIVASYGRALVDIGGQREDIVVLDADLAADCGLRPFERMFPDRFIENGIAEQDMVSMAGGLALQGMLPIVNSFGAFLASRANEQIYTNAGEKTKIIYVCHYAGLIPAGPGKSHQSVRDISLLSALPEVEIIQPCNAAETRWAVDYCINRSRKNCVLRLIIGPSPGTLALPADYQFTPGKGAVLKEGRDAVLFSYGPVMLNEAIRAAEILMARNVAVKVVNMPWLNQVDVCWIKEVIGNCEHIYILEDHAPEGGLGAHLITVLAEAQLIKNKRVKIFGVAGAPGCGMPAETLAHHRLDGGSVAQRIFPS